MNNHLKDNPRAEQRCVDRHYFPEGRLIFLEKPGAGRSLSSTKARTVSGASSFGWRRLSSNKSARGAKILCKFLSARNLPFSTSLSPLPKPQGPLLAPSPKQTPPTPPATQLLEPLQSRACPPDHQRATPQPYHGSRSRTRASAWADTWDLLYHGA